MSRGPSVAVHLPQEAVGRGKVGKCISTLCESVIPMYNVISVLAVESTAHFTESATHRLAA